jgi:hypothetical protein
MIVLETGCFGTFGDLVLSYFFLAGVFFPVLSFLFFSLSFFCFLSFAAGARERVGGGSFDICVAEEEEEGEQRTCLRIFG